LEDERSEAQAVQDHVGGLHVAQRLVAEDGGSLELAEVAGPWSSFVISLPAARRSPENDVVVGGGSHGWNVAR